VHARRLRATALRRRAKEIQNADQKAVNTTWRVLISSQRRSMFFGSSHGQVAKAAVSWKASRKNMLLSGSQIAHCLRAVPVINAVRKNPVALPGHGSSV